MYGPTSMGADASYELASVDIETIPGRVGQRVRNELIFLFTGGGHPAEPQYRLEIALRESEQGVLYKRTEDSSGKIYSLDATYVLRDASGKKELTKGGSHARAAFDKVDSTFANIRARRDAENRAARDIARDINNRIAAYISSQR
jgi:LPS-assembly lipoprotein